MENKSITALMSAFGRAFHAENEKNPVFSDTLAKSLMTEDEYNSVGDYIFSGAEFFEPERDFSTLSKNEVIRQIINTHIAPSPLCRQAYAEKMLKNAFFTGTEQYVILGAGLDTFALRDKKHKVYEVDSPLTQEDKIKRIRRAGLEIPENLTFVPLDFEKENLVLSNFDGTKKTFFSWLGVTYYLSQNAIEKTLKDIYSLCPEGSSIVFDYPDENFFSAKEKRVQNTILMARFGGEEMKTCFSYSELEKLLENCGFLIYEHLTPADIQRDIIDVSGAEMKAFEHVNYCLAVKK